jgi:cation transport ATPase
VRDPCAVATLGFWLGTGLPAAAAWSAAVAVLVVACPCALILTFRNAGTVTVEAAVTAPGTP